MRRSKNVFPTEALPPIPEGSTFTMGEVYEFIAPHPYCIGPRHIEYASKHTGGLLSDDAIMRSERVGAKCCVPHCEVKYADHELQIALALVVEQNTDLASIPGLKDYLTTIQPGCTSLGINAFVFPTPADIARERELEREAALEQELRATTEDARLVEESGENDG